MAPRARSKLAPPCSNLRCFASKCTVWRKYLWRCWDFLAPGELRLLYPSSLRPWWDRFTINSCASCTYWLGSNRRHGWSRFSRELFAVVVMKGICIFIENTNINSFPAKCCYAHVGDLDYILWRSDSRVVFEFNSCTLYQEFNRVASDILHPKKWSWSDGSSKWSENEETFSGNGFTCLKFENWQF